MLAPQNGVWESGERSSCCVHFALPSFLIFFLQAPGPLAPCSWPPRTHSWRQNVNDQFRRYVWWVYHFLSLAVRYVVQFYELAVCSPYFASTFVVFDGFVHDGQRLVSPTEMSLEKDFYSKMRKWSLVLSWTQWWGCCNRAWPLRYGGLGRIVTYN